MRIQNRYSPETRKRAVRMVFEHRARHRSQWATILSVAAKLGCTAQSLHRWVSRARQQPFDVVGAEPL